MSNENQLDRYGRRLYPVTCADCGKACSVPFKPDPTREVYCQTCYANHRPQRTKKY